jgi:type II secretory pathway component PulM
MRLRFVISSLLARFDQLNTRERKLVTYGGILATLLITWFVLIEPAMMIVQQAPAKQSALIDHVAKVMRAAEDLDVLRGSRSRFLVAEGNLQTRLQQLLEEQGIAEQAKLFRTEEGDIRVEFTGVSASGFLAWLAVTESIPSVSLNQAEMSKVDVGILSGSVTLLSNARENLGAQL